MKNKIILLTMYKYKYVHSINNLITNFLFSKLT